MSIFNLDALFRPLSVAVIGASNRPRSVGSLVMKNLLAGGFSGPVMPVNPNHRAIAGVLAYPDIASLPIVPDMAVICTPAASVPGLIAELSARGTRSATVLSAGMTTTLVDGNATAQEAMLRATRKTGLRVLGPNCLGFLVPGVALNASFAHASALPGKIAFVSQSGALCTAVLDWARSRGIGFSHFISLGDSADVDFGDILDYLSTEPETTAILLYIEAIKSARKFMSAARGASRNKPILAIKAGRMAEGAKAAASHTGALAGADDVYDAAMRRAGMLRVYEIDELFDAAETLARAKPARGDRLAILTNGGGPGVLAADALIAGGGRLAALDTEAIAKLDAVLPSTWSHGNPIDIIGDAPGDRYAKALEVLLKDPGIDATLVMHAPTAVASSEEVARSVVDVARASHRTVLTSWLGTDAVESARRVFAENGVPTYETSDNAVRAFLHLVRYRRNREMLTQTPASIPSEFTPSRETCLLVIENAMAAGRTLLTEPEAKAVLAAYGVPIVETHIARTAEDAEHIAKNMGFPVAIKILSDQISHKSDVGGVALDLESPQAVRAAAQAMLGRVAKLLPDAKVTGFTVQKMARRPGAHELIVGVTTDPIFGPVILFGQGGTAVEVIADRAVTLPPLNAALADELIGQTRISRLLRGFRDRPPVDLDALRLTLIQISQIIVDIPEIVELDINPLFADSRGVLALDARIRVESARSIGPERLAIRPYPRELEESIALGSGRKVTLRPIRPEDEPEHKDFVSRLSPEDIRFRFFGLVRDFPHSQLARFTQIDYDREMAFIASASVEHGHETLGVVRAVFDLNHTTAEFAIVVRSDVKGQGLGRELLKKMIRYCQGRGLRKIVGQVLPDNAPMLSFVKGFGFELTTLPSGEAVQVVLRLDSVP